MFQLFKGFVAQFMPKKKNADENSEYHDEFMLLYGKDLHEQIIRLSTPLLAIYLLFLFLIYQDVFAFKQTSFSYLIWRVIPIVLVLVFKFILIPVYRNNQRVLKSAYVLTLISSIIMMCSISYQLFGTKYFEVSMNGMLVAEIGVFLMLRGGAWVAAFCYLIPLSVMIAVMIATSKFEAAIPSLVNPVFVAFMAILLSGINDRGRKREIMAKLIIGKKNEIIVEKNAELARANEQLKENDIAKSRFISNISHELRTPLTLILGPLESLTDGVYGNAVSSDSPVFDSMLRNGRRLLLMINQLLDFSSIEAGKLKMRNVRTDVSQLMKQLIASVEQTARLKGLSITFFDETGGLTCNLDPELIVKAVLNLLSNAVKFTPAGGSVSVVLDRAGKEFSVAVRDSGPGIPEDKQERIFERFYQLDSESTRKYEGSGIGLSLSREIVEWMGGRIALSSKPGKGSLFTISLPALQDETALLADSAGEASIPGGYLLSDIEASSQPDMSDDDRVYVNTADASAPKVLVVDDNADMRRYIRDCLAPCFSVIEAGNGRNALKAARELTPDIVLSDVLMPGMDGIALLKEIRADEKLIDIPVILLTALSGMENRLEGLETGAIDYIEKPFQVRELTARIQGQIRMKSLRAVIREKNAALDLSEDRFRDIAEFAVSGIAETDGSFRIEYLNRTGRTLLGFPEGQEKTQPFTRHFAESDQDKLSQLLQSRNTEIPLFKMTKADGTPFTALLKSSALGSGESRYRFAFMDINPVLGMTLQPGNAFFEHHHLSSREREIFTELVKDLSIREIAAKMFISENTVKSHVQSIYGKMGISGRKELLQTVKKEIVAKRGYETLLFSLLSDAE